MLYASTIAVFNDKKEILIIKRSDKVDSFPGHWGLPGGKIEKNETPEQAAARELREETGLKTNEDDLYYLYTIHRESNKEIVCFTAEDYKGKVILNEESSDYKWIAPRDLHSVNLIPTPGVFIRLLEMWAEFAI